MKKKLEDTYYNIIDRCFDTTKFVEQLDKMKKEDVISIMQKFMTNFNSFVDYNLLIKWALEKDYKEVVRILLSDGRTRIIIINANSLIFAAASDFFQGVDMLLKNKDISESVVNLALIFASMKGYIEVVKVLMKDERVDLSWGILFAKQAHHPNIIKLLSTNINGK